ncbi:MAG: hypothetical protein WC947_10210 [Elusimicrobiota bacterium]
MKKFKLVKRLIFLFYFLIPYCFIFALQKDSPPDHRNFSSEMLELLMKEDFTKLDAVSHKLRTTKEKFPGGDWKLTAFYIGIGEPLNNQKDGDEVWESQINKLKKWIKKNPDSISARVGLGRILYEYAWKARSNKLAYKVTEEGWELFRKRLAESEKILNEAKNLPEKCPYWYRAIQTVALGQSWNRERYDELFEEAIKFELEYWDYYTAKAHYLLPRWHGRPGEWEQFAEEISDRVGGKKGSIIYGYICQTIGKFYKQEKCLTETDVSWEKLKQGFYDREELYGTSIRNLNVFCKYAWHADDRKTAKELFKRIGDNYDKQVWKSKVNLDRAKEWVKSSKSSDTVSGKEIGETKLAVSSRKLADSGKGIDETKLAVSSRKLTDEDIKKLEEQIKTNPDDLSARIKLLGNYFTRRRHSDSINNNRQQHVLWIIQNRPESEIAGTPYVELDPELDGEVYRKAKAIWLKHIETKKKDTRILGNAAHFFLLFDSDLAEKFFKKAQSLEPQNPEWSGQLGHLYRLKSRRRNISNDKKKETAKKSLDEYEKSLNLETDERSRFYQLSKLTRAAFETEEINKAENYAKELLALAPKYKNDWNYGNAIHHGNTVLGRISLKSGDMKKAKHFLLESGKTPGSPQLNSFGPSMILAKELLEKGEKGTAIEYLELCKKFWRGRKSLLDEWIGNIKQGEKPHFKNLR